MNRRVILETVLRFCLAGVFIYAGEKKVPDIETFFWDIHHFELTHPDVSLVMAFFLPWLEIFAGCALVARRLYLGAVAVCTFLSVLFLGAIGSAWYRGLDITCGCFGREDNATNFPKHIAINAVMLIASLALWWLAIRRSKAAQAPPAVEATVG